MIKANYPFFADHEAKLTRTSPSWRCPGCELLPSASWDDPDAAFLRNGGWLGVLPTHGMVDLMTQPSGWYEDPENPSQLRYWDGVVWSGNTSPKVSPNVEQSTIGMPYGVVPASAHPGSPTSQGAHDRPAAPGGYVSPQQGAGQQQGVGPQGVGPQDLGPQDLGPQSGQWPAYGQGPGQFGHQGWAPQTATTPDGVALSGWWKRVLAQLIDSIVVAIAALPFAFAPLKVVFTFFLDLFQKAMAAAEAGRATPTVATDQLTGPLLQISLTLLVVSLVYEIGLLTRTGATIGKKAVGISVRLRDRPGPPTLVAVLKRTAVKKVGSVFGSVPFVGFLASLFSLVDVLWPLWDGKKQAIHDKAATTNVVVGPQPKRGALSQRDA